MTDLDRQSRLYAADRLLDSMDGTFRAQHIKQAYMDGYNAARREFFLDIDINHTQVDKSKTFYHLATQTSTP